MDKSYQNAFQKIFEASKKNKLTFFVGAGLSALSNAPNWTSLIKEIYKELKLGKPPQKYSWDECLRIPQMYYCELKNHYKGSDVNKRYYNLLRKYLDNKDLRPNEIHKKIFSLNPASIITTNFDNLLEIAAIENGKTYKSIACDVDVPKIDGDRFILKIHGDLRNENIVFKEEDYLNYSTNFKLIETLTKSIFSTNTIVFIGYSLNDYNVNLIINWVKALLGDKFNPPIFLYLDHKKLNNSTIQYYKDVRRLTVIDCNILAGRTRKEDFLKRYSSFFSKFIKWSNLYYNQITYESIVDNNVTDKELFNILYLKLAPLDVLCSVRISDVRKQLNTSDVVINETGCIITVNSDTVHPLFKYFLKLHKKSSTNNSRIIKSDICKYDTVRRVLKKASIFFIRDKNEYIQLSEGRLIPINSDCIMYDYKKMECYVSKERKTVESKIKRAFYLTRLLRFDEALIEFQKISLDSFNNKNYFSHYLSKVYVINLSKIIRQYNIDTSDEIDTPSSEISTLFSSLPHSFKIKYSFLNTLHEPVELYKLAYKSILTTKRLTDTVSKNSTTIGITPLIQVNHLLFEQMRFILDNSITLDLFSEFSNSISSLIESKLYAYSMQQQKKIRSYVEIVKTEKIIFNEFDLYCMVEHFQPKELKNVINQFCIQTIEYSNPSTVQKQLLNIFNFFNTRKNTNNYLDFLNLRKVRNALIILSHMTLNIKTFEIICGFIFSDKFNSLFIQDCHYFLTQQVIEQKLFSPVVNQLIFDKLIQFHDMRLCYYNTGQKSDDDFFILRDFRLLSYFITPTDKQKDDIYKCSIDIINNNIKVMFSDVLEYYWYILGDFHKVSIISTLESILIKQFEFNLFRVVVNLICNAKLRIPSSLSLLLNQYCKQMVANNNTSHLPQIGFWCFIDILERIDYDDYLGLNPLFDFFFDCKKFDYNRFELSWLFDFDDSILSHISQNTHIREHVRPLIANTLKNGLIKTEHDRLYKILITYFC